MGCKTVLIVAFFCTLKCGLSQPTKGNKLKNMVEMWMPLNSMRNPPLYQQQNRVLFPYNSQFSYGCNSCQSSICNKRCSKKNKQMNFKLPKNLLRLSIPLNGERINIILDNRSPSQAKGEEGKPTFNNVNLDVSVMKVGSEGNNSNDGIPLPSSVATNSTATTNQEHGNIIQETTANVTVGNVTLEVKASLSYDNSGDMPQDIRVQSNMKAEDGQGDKSMSGLKSEIDEMPEDNPSDPKKPSTRADEPSAQNPALPNNDNLPHENTDKTAPADSSPLPDKVPKNKPSNTDSAPDKPSEVPASAPTNSSPEKDPNKEPSQPDSAPDKLSPPTDSSKDKDPNEKLSKPDSARDKSSKVPASPDIGSPVAEETPASPTSPSEGKKPTGGDSSADSASTSAASDAAASINNGDASAASAANGEAASGP